MRWKIQKHNRLESRLLKNKNGKLFYKYAIIGSTQFYFLSFSISFSFYLSSFTVWVKFTITLLWWALDQPEALDDTRIKHVPTHNAPYYIYLNFVFIFFFSFFCCCCCCYFSLSLFRLSHSPLHKSWIGSKSTFEYNSVLLVEIICLHISSLGVYIYIYIRWTIYKFEYEFFILPFIIWMSMSEKVCRHDML